MIIVNHHGIGPIIAGGNAVNVQFDPHRTPHRGGLINRFGHDFSGEPRIQIVFGQANPVIMLPEIAGKLEVQGVAQNAANAAEDH